MKLWDLKRLRIAKISCFAAFLAFFYAPVSVAVEYSPDKLKWNTLTYSGSKFFMSMDTSVSVDLISNDQAKQELIKPPEGDGKHPVSNEIVKINVQNKVVGSDTDFTVWLEPNTSVLQRTSIYGGVKEWYRTYRFMDNKVFSDKRKPANRSEKGEPWQSWSNLYPGFFTLDDSEKSVVISESEALFYLIGIADLNKVGDQTTLNIYDRSGVIAATVKVVGTTQLLVDYRVQQGGASTRVNKKIPALEAVMEARPIKAGGNLDEFKFLGYKDDIRMVIDPELNTILQISGSIEYVGEVTIRLQQVSLNP